MTSQQSHRARRQLGLLSVLAGIGLVVAARAAVGQPTHRTAVLLPASPPPAAQQSAQQSTSVTPATSTAPAASGPVTVDGSVIDTPYGPVQVAVVFNGRRIVDVRTLRMPQDADRSIRLAALAAPQLRQEVLTAQSARIDTVSGATYDSDGYAQSVQYAIDHSHG
jgi:uncharacterized protein with FMN-binding domain